MSSNDERIIKEAMNLKDPKTYSDFKWLFIDIPRNQKKWLND